MTDNPTSPGSVPSHFPAHDGPRVWVISAGTSPIGISLARQLLAHGDIVVAGVPESNPEREDPRYADFEALLDELSTQGVRYRERMKPVIIDIRSAAPEDLVENWTPLALGKPREKMMNECQIIVAEAISAFGRVDVLICCTSQAIIGTVEELAASERTRLLVKDQFETNYFGPVNLIKAVLPQFRRQKTGHILVVGGITGHLGTPGLGVYCAAGWALEGFCDSLAYEIAPFNIRLTILQCSIEIGILTNLITSVPPILPAYSPSTNYAPLFRGIMNGLLSRLPNLQGSYSQSPEAAPEAYPSASPVSPSASSTTSTNTKSNTNSGTNPSPNTSRQMEDTEADHDEEHIGSTGNEPLSAPAVVSIYPPLSPAHLDVLIAETIHAITAIGGHENPPARHIVGAEGIAAVKEKLKTVTEELEDFIECSSAVDINVDPDAGSLSAGGAGGGGGGGGQGSNVGAGDEGVIGVL